MPPRQRDPIVYGGTGARIRGRDGSTASQLDIPAYKARECLNVDFYRCSLGRKRGGALDVFGLTTSENTASVVSMLARHVPGADETLAELWQVTGAATPVMQRLAGGTAWATITVGDAIATRPQDAVAISFNGKLFWLYDSTVDRGHVYDPATSTTALRRMGLTNPASAPSVADTGSGSYAAVIRYYKVRYTIQISSVTVLRSEASAVQTFTPSGSGTHARVTKPSSVSENETHWELYGSVGANGPFYLIATTAVGTTTYDDGADPATYGSGTLEPLVGQHTTPSSFKFGIADGARLLLLGTHETSLDPSSVYYTPVLGTTTSSYYDDERVPAVNRIPLDPKDGGVGTGFGGPFENQVVVFKQRQVWRLIPTGIAEDPYRRKAVSKVVGCIRQQSVVMAEDEAGNPCLYWLSHLGPYRFSPREGLSKLVWDVKDIWDTVNLAASTATCHGVYHSDVHQIWWWVAVGSENEPTTTKLVFDTRLGRMTESGDVRDGWCVHDGASASARCSVMFSNTLGATMSRDLKPYIGQHGGNGRLWKCDTADLDDVGTAFQGLITFPDRHYAGLPMACAIGTPSLLGAVSASTISVTMTPNYGAHAALTGSTSLAAVGSETRALKQVEGVSVGDDVFAVAVAIGDASATASPRWVLDALHVPVEDRQALGVA